MAARWPYALVLAFVGVMAVGHFWEPFVGLGYLAVPLLAAVAWYAVVHKSPFRLPLVAAVGIMCLGFGAFALTWVFGLTELGVDEFIAVELSGFFAVAGLLVLPAVGLLTGIVGLVGGILRPGVRVERMPIEPVGGID